MGRRATRSPEAPGTQDASADAQLHPGGVQGPAGRLARRVMTSTAAQTLPNGLAWFKSSYSGSAGGNCLEVAYDWRKSSHSSDQGGACLEVAPCAHAIHVRDSKNPG